MWGGGRISSLHINQPTFGFFCAMLKLIIPWTLWYCVIPCSGSFWGSSVTKIRHLRLSLWRLTADAVWVNSYVAGWRNLFCTFTHQSVHHDSNGNSKKMPTGNKKKSPTQRVSFGLQAARHVMYKCILQRPGIRAACNLPWSSKKVAFGDMDHPKHPAFLQIRRITPGGWFAGCKIVVFKWMFWGGWGHWSRFGRGFNHWIWGSILQFSRPE